MANPRGHVESLGTVPLAEGEVSRPVRVRAQAWVFERLRTMSAAEVGALLSSALHGQSGQSLSALHVELPRRVELPEPLAGILADLQAGGHAELSGRRWYVVHGEARYAVKKGDLAALEDAGHVERSGSTYHAS